MSQAAAEAIQAPTDQNIELPTLGISDQGVQGRAAILGPRDAVIDVLLSCLTPSRHIVAEFLELILRRLIEGGNSGIDGCPEWFW